MAPVNITINGQKTVAESGQTVLEAAAAAGIEIPSLCHHPALKPIGACRICLVEIARQRTLQPACTYLVTEGLEIQTESPQVVQVRRFVLDMLFSERNHYCMYCETSGNCELQDLGYRYGIDHWIYPTYHTRFPVDATRATFLMDHNRCILCRRCVRACSELVANHTLGMRHRGAASMISADMNVPFGESSCISCGTCLQVCPTGALIDKRSAFMGRDIESERIKSTCSQCSIGCGMEIVVRGGQMLRLEGDWDAAVNRGLLCQKGRFDPLYDPRTRVTSPLVRQGGTLRAADWDAALQATARELGRTAADKVGVLASTQATNEALYLVSQLFGEGLGTRNTGLLNATVSRLPHPHGALADIDQSDLILVVGADPSQEQPVASFFIKRNADLAARLIMVDDKDNGLAPFAHLNLGLSELEQAVDMARRAEFPVVVYGSGLTAEAADALKALDKGSFLALESGVNTRAAVAYGLNGGFDLSAVETLYILLGEQAWDRTEALQQVPEEAFVVVQASYESPLTERADVVLPMAIWSERTGSLTNFQGQVQTARQAVQPAGQARPDWEILSSIAQALGKGQPISLTELSVLAVRELS